MGRWSLSLAVVQVAFSARPTSLISVRDYLQPPPCRTPCPTRMAPVQPFFHYRCPSDLVGRLCSAAASDSQLHARFENLHLLHDSSGPLLCRQHSL